MAYAFVDDSPSEEDQMSKPDKFYTDALEAAKLSVATMRVYNSNLKMLQGLGGTRHTTDYVIRHPTQTYALICKKTSKSMSRKTYIGAVMSLFKNVPGLAERHPKELVVWQQAHTEECAAADEWYTMNKATERQEHTHVPWPEVLRVRDELPRDGMDYLFLSMYTYLPPARLDYDRLAMLMPRDKEPTTPAELEAEPNYVVISSPRQMTMHLNAYKSKPKDGPGMTQDLPPVLCAIVWASLQRKPRRYLFNELITGEPFKTSTAHIVYASRLLKRVLKNNAVSVSALRHSFITNLPARLKAGVREDIARRMMHGVAQSLCYNLLTEGEGEYDVSKMGEQ